MVFCVKEKKLVKVHFSREISELIDVRGAKDEKLIIVHFSI